MIRQLNRTGLALFCLMGLGAVFDLEIWPTVSDVKPEQYSYVVLDGQDSVKAIESYRRLTHLNKIGFYKNFFIESDQKLTPKSYVWFLAEFLILIGVTFLWFKEASDYSKDFILVFLFFVVGNLVDFGIHYNENYTPNISFNILSFIMYAIFLTYKGWKDR